MAIADSYEVTVRLGKSSPTTEETALIEKRLGDVERMIRRRITDLDAQLAADPPTIDVEDVKQVEAEAVLRLVRNPDGYLSESDGDYSYMLMQDLASGKLEILPNEWEILGVTVSSGMFLIIPTPVMPT